MVSEKEKLKKQRKDILDHKALVRMRKIDSIKLDIDNQLELIRVSHSEIYDRFIGLIPLLENYIKSEWAVYHDMGHSKYSKGTKTVSGIYKDIKNAIKQQKTEEKLEKHREEIEFFLKKQGIPSPFSLVEKSEKGK